MLLLAAAAIVAGAVLWGCFRVVRELEAVRRSIGRTRILEVLAAFRPAAEAAAADPRAVLAWEPVAQMGRRLFPKEFEALDRASGAAFPFGGERLEAAHAQWTTDWLTWERAHDAEYKLKAAEAQRDLGQADAAIVRGRLDAIEREKLERYQRRYEEYVRVAKALQALMPASSSRSRE